MITTLTIGPMLDPLTFEERRAIQRFIMVGIERGGEVDIWQDHTIGAVWAIAKVPGPTAPAVTTGATP